MENEIHLEHVSPPRPVGSSEFLSLDESSAVCGDTAAGKTLLQLIQKFGAVKNQMFGRAMVRRVELVLYRVDLNWEGDVALHW